MTSQKNRIGAVVFLGASEFDYIPELNNSAFHSSKENISKLLTTEYLVAEQIESLDLFNFNLRPGDLVTEVKDFLARTRKRPLTDIILYYCGHGAIVHPDTLCLMLKLSRPRQEATTTLTLAAFQHDLRAELAGKRIFIFLDCCYAAAAVKDLMNVSISPLMSRLEVTGTALFAAASVDSAAQAPAGEDMTLFSGHLASAIRNGVPDASQPELSLSALAEYVREKIQQEPDHRRVIPELHTPKLTAGNISLFPLFRNKSSASQSPLSASEPSKRTRRSTDPRFNKRPNDLFVSYCYGDRARVEPLIRWLRLAGMEVARNSGELASADADTVASSLESARAALLCVSRACIASSSWEAISQAAIDQKRTDRRYRVIALRLDDCGLPRLLEVEPYIEMQTLDVRLASDLLMALLPEPAPWFHGDRDVYLSMSWHPEDAKAADPICFSLTRTYGFRLIGDSPDYSQFDEKLRVKHIMGSCGALVAVLPFRNDAANGFTSKWIVKEVQLARELSLPYLLFAADGVSLDLELSGGAVGQKAFSMPRSPDDQAVATTIHQFEEEYRAPPRPAYSFFATSLRRHGEDTLSAVALVEQITGMRCLLGENLQGQHAQREIIDRIRKAEFVLADISENDHNSLIEAGIARGAGTNLHLLCERPASGELSTRFMLRDLEVSWYADSIERLGKIVNTARRYRRRIIRPGAN